jgi:hypothetical protein
MCEQGLVTGNMFWAELEFLLNLSAQNFSSRGLSTKLCGSWYYKPETSFPNAWKN